MYSKYIKNKIVFFLNHKFCLSKDFIRLNLLHRWMDKASNMYFKNIVVGKW